MSANEPEKLELTIDFGDIRKAINQSMREKALSIIEGSVDMTRLKEAAKGALTQGVLSNAKIVDSIIDQCEYSIAAAVREALEGQSFRDHIAGIVSELLADQDFNNRLKLQIEESVLRRA